MANKIVVRPLMLRKHTMLITNHPVTKEPINLVGKDVTKTYPATDDTPKRDETIRGATQADLQAIWKACDGHSRVLMEAYEEPVKTTKSSSGGNS